MSHRPFGGMKCQPAAVHSKVNPILLWQQIENNLQRLWDLSSSIGINITKEPLYPAQVDSACHFMLLSEATSHKRRLSV
jgi:hypothetical protein